EALRTYVLYVVGLTLAVTVPIGASLALFGTPVISAVFGNGYALAAGVLPVLVIGQILYGLYVVLAGAWTWGLGRPQIDPVATGAAVIVTVGLGLILVPHFG